MKQPTDVEIREAIVEVLSQEDDFVPFNAIADKLFEKYGRVALYVIQSNLHQLTLLGTVKAEHHEWGGSRYQFINKTKEGNQR